MAKFRRASFIKHQTGEMGGLEERSRDKPRPRGTLIRIMNHPIVHTLLFALGNGAYAWYRWLVSGPPPLWESVPFLILSAGVGLVFGTLFVSATGEVALSKRTRNTRLFIGIALVISAILIKLLV